ncbi:SMAD/FHA domain-containing protein [Amylocystis lapponica]|nr:SMAD/FHA domain-containing protein [Amylocystis lapponica]
MARNSVSPPRRRFQDDRRQGMDGDREDDYRRRRPQGAGGERRDSGYNRREERNHTRRGDDAAYGGYDRRNRERDVEQRRDRSRERERERGGDRVRDRNGDRDRDRDQRAGPSRRSVSPRPRPPTDIDKPPSRSRSKTGEEDKAKPNFAPSGLLAAATKTVKHGDGTSTVLKYHEPPEARKPVVGWRLYVFKGKDQVDLLHIQRQSAYLIGRDRAIADLAIDHPSCSKQHAVIQYRQVHEKNELGDVKNVIKPFIIDLESTNGTHVNDEAIPVSRYYELKPGDVIKFGESMREYVILHDEAV